MSTGEKIALASLIIALFGFIASILYPILYLTPPSDNSNPLITVQNTPNGTVITRVDQKGEEILITTITLEDGKKKITYNILTSTVQTSTPIIAPTSTPIITPTSAPIMTSKPPEGKNPPIDWGIMTEYFDISDVTLGEAEYTDVLGSVYKYDSINFIVEAKRSFYAIIIFEAEFYDEDGIKLYSSFIDFDPNYDQWQSGDRSKAYLELPSTSDMEKVQHIKISQFM